VSSWSTPTAWRPSTALGGSPGSDDSGVIPEAGAVVINELLASASGGGPDWVELYNTTNRSIDLGGWFLSDEADKPTKYEIALGTILRPRAHLVLTEDRQFGNLQSPGCHEPFGLGRAGESLYLCSGSQGWVTGYWEQAEFGASDVDLTYGRHLDGAGGVHFVPLRGATPGAANDDPAVGPVIIKELMYHAVSPGDVEYIELQNVGDTEVTLYDSAQGTPWRIVSGSDGGGIDLLLPQNPPIVLSPRGCLLLVKDRGLFLSRYIAPASMQLLEWGMGGLRDTGDTVRLCRPGDLDNDIRTWISVDEVTYSNGAHPDAFPDGLDPWPAQADGTGQALVRIDSQRWADDPANWRGATASFATVSPPTGGRQRSGR
jgi:hypothetical protein